jgi:Flp pilus assembly protein TadG
MRSQLKMLVRLARCSSGSALVEMTFVVPIAIALMVGVVDFGMVFSARATLGKSVRDAARYVAGLPAGACSTSSTFWANSYANSLITNVLPSATPSVTCSPCPSPPFRPDSNCVTASATLSYNSIIRAGAISGYLPALPSTFNLSAQHQEVQVGGS